MSFCWLRWNQIPRPSLHLSRVSILSSRAMSHAASTSGRSACAGRVRADGVRRNTSKSAARDRNERLPALEGALLRHGVFVQTASFLFVSEAFDEKVVAEAARRWERAVSEVYGNTAL